MRADNHFLEGQKGMFAFDRGILAVTLPGPQRA